MDIEAEATRQSSISRNRAKRNRASTSSAAPPNTFQIILEKIDGLREVQNHHTEGRLTTSTLTRSIDPLAIPVKKGEIILQQHQQHLKGSVCLRGRSFRYCFKFLFMFWIIIDWP